MKTFILLSVLILTACGAEDEKVSETADGGHTVVTYNAPVDECSTGDRSDEELEEHYANFIETYKQKGTDDLPIQALDRVLVLTKVPYDLMKKEDRRRNGVLERVTCLDKRTAYRISIVDPESVPSGHAMRDPLLFKETVFHELGHVFYGHYDDDDTTVTSKAGLMAASKDIKSTTAADHEMRISKFFGDASYKARLPKHFHVAPEAQAVDPRTEGEGE